MFYLITMYLIYIFYLIVYYNIGLLIFNFLLIDTNIFRCINIQYVLYTHRTHIPIYTDFKSSKCSEINNINFRNIYYSFFKKYLNENI